MESIIGYVILFIIITVIAAIVLSSFTTIQQGTVGVTQVFGKFKRIMLPGLNFKIPLIETVVRRVSIQNQTSELKFQAITQDQANVNFSAMLIYAVLNSEGE